ncbi:MAG: hypothetical protein QOG53_1735 [Frankiales bacterium]|jgi:photosystem II stability/assembly factor-like uncharacterized protein|nr:hypothetical protein [Frankiales bacterium]
MPFVVATSDGLIRVDDRGRMKRLADGDFIHVVLGEEDGEAVALDSQGQLWDVDDEGAAPYNEFTDGRANCLLVDGHDVWVGAQPASLFRLKDDGFHRIGTFEQLPGHEKWTTPWGASAAVRSLDIGDDETVWANIHVGGIARSRDGGATWTSMIDPDVDVHQVFVVPGRPETVVAACGNGGLAMTTDKGGTWTMSTAGLSSTYCRAVAVAEDTILLSCQDDNRGGNTSLYRRPLDDMDAPFVPVGGGLPAGLPGSIDTFSVATYGEDAAVALPSGDLYISADAGYAWRRLIGSLGDVRAVTIL